MTIEPVIQRIEVPVGQAEAFQLFTERLDSWWPLVGHSCTEDVDASVDFEPRVGGQVIEISADKKSRFVWGTLTEWDSPKRFSMTWHPGRDADLATKLTVEFSEGSDHCVVSIHHGGFDVLAADGENSRNAYAHGWIGVLELLRHAAAQRAHTAQQ